MPLRVYFKKGRAKVELVLAKGKKVYDKRKAMAERDAQRKMARALREKERY
ncbi:MAG TPA: SsrA-binding protein [Clostridia bacterium]|nr:SsrA-binding protein [Clostridia bacterium]